MDLKYDDLIFNANTLALQADRLCFLLNHCNSLCFQRIENGLNQSRVTTFGTFKSFFVQVIFRNGGNLESSEK